MYKVLIRASVGKANYTLHSQQCNVTHGVFVYIDTAVQYYNRDYYGTGVDYSLCGQY